MSDDILREIRDDVRSHGETLARIDERTQQHEKRMDRTERKSAGISGAGGLLGGTLVVFLKSFFSPGGSS
jgi:hypothetical protein